MQYPSRTRILNFWFSRFPCPFPYPFPVPVPVSGLLRWCQSIYIYESFNLFLLHLFFFFFSLNRFQWLLLRNQLECASGVTYIKSHIFIFSILTIITTTLRLNSSLHTIRVLMFPMNLMVHCFRRTQLTRRGSKELVLSSFGSIKHRPKTCFGVLSRQKEHHKILGS